MPTDTNSPPANDHGVADVDAVHAHTNAIRFIELDDGALIAVGLDSAGLLLEVGFRMVTRDGHDAVRVFHVMAARAKWMQ
jgi:hypothetical protein